MIEYIYCSQCKDVFKKEDATIVLHTKNAYCSMCASGYNMYDEWVGIPEDLKPYRPIQ